MAVYALLLHAAFTGDEYYRNLAEKTLSSTQPLVDEDPSGFPFWLHAYGFCSELIFKQVALYGRKRV